MTWWGSRRWRGGSGALGLVCAGDLMLCGSEGVWFGFGWVKGVCFWLGGDGCNGMGGEGTWVYVLEYTGGGEWGWLLGGAVCILRAFQVPLGGKSQQQQQRDIMSLTTL